MKDILQLKQYETITIGIFKYYYTFCNYDYDVNTFTYNVYVKFLWISWPIYTIENDSKDYCIKKCKEFLSNKKSNY